MFLNDLPTLDTSQPIQLPALDTSSFMANLPSLSFSDPAPTPDIPTLPTTYVTYTPTPTSSTDIPMLPLTTVNYTPNIPTLPTTVVNYTPTTPSVPATNVAPQAPAAPQSSTSDWFSRNIMPLLSTGLQTYAAVKQYDTQANIAAANLQAQQAAIAKGLPAGVSSSYLATRPTLTAQQLATMTPAQQQAYYAQLQSAYSGVGTGGMLSSLGLGGMDTTTLMLLAGGSLLLMMMLMKK